MIKYAVSFLLTLITCVYFTSCSTEKNTAVNRFYHGMTAHYNGYFNANELIRQSISSYRTSRVEDFYTLLPIDPLPNEEEVISLYPAIDTAIVKCAKVIQRHSMPSNDNPSAKKEEHNAWIDENWTTIGIANFYRRDYYAALKAFNYVKKFYSNDPSIFIGELWIARTNIELGKLTEAGFNLDNLDKALEEEKNGSKDEVVKKGEKPIKKAKVPKGIYADIFRVKAELSLRKGEWKDAAEYLTQSLEYTKTSSEKARIHFIIAQLNEKLGNRAEAMSHYSSVTKYNAQYPLIFNARMKRAFNGGDDKVKKELLKMLRDQKNAQFKDQIYYALAEMELQQNNKEQGVIYLTKSAFYSTSNTRQKGMAYEKLGNISFADRNYVSAQKYYDSCVTVINDAYPNAEGIRNKATKLADLVLAVETANFEDSVQRIAAMSEKDREHFLKEVIKKIKEDEERRKKQEAERLRELQQNQNLFVQNNSSGNMWYFSNPKTRSEGYDEFRKLWGVRDNEDNWRRSDKTTFTSFSSSKEDSTATDTETEVKKDTLTVEILMKNVPMSDSALTVSRQRLIDAWYQSGLIYKEQLGETEMAILQFTKVRNKSLKGNTDLSSAYQLYKIYDASKSSKSDTEKRYILDTYPTSDYANYLLDPDFFVKRKERELMAEEEYVKILDKYNRGYHYDVAAITAELIEKDPKSKFRSKYMLLRSMALGQVNSDKKVLLPILNQIVSEYPGTIEAKRAQEMITIIQNGYSTNQIVDFGKKSPYFSNEKAEHWVMIILEKSEASNTVKSKVSDFNREFFSKSALKVSSKIFGDNDQSVVLVQDFDNDEGAKEYVRTFKLSKKHVNSLKNYKIFAITQENLKILFDTKQLQEYELFYDEFY